MWLFRYIFTPVAFFRQWQSCQGCFTEILKHFFFLKHKRLNFNAEIFREVPVAFYA